MPVTINVNGDDHTIDAEPDTPLLWAIRDHIQLTGTKFGCGMALCGACTVHIDGAPVRSCVTPISSIAGKRVTTIEGVRSRTARAVQAAWEKHAVPQCGYCQSGQIMSASRCWKRILRRRMPTSIQRCPAISAAAPLT